MFTLEELSSKIDGYRSGLLTIGEFGEWFEDRATADAYDNPELHETCVAIGAALVEFQFDGIGVEEMKRELAKAVRPFVVRSSGVEVVRYDVVQGNAAPLRLPAFAAGAFALVMVSTWGVVPQQSRQLQMNECGSSEPPSWTIEPSLLAEPRQAERIES